MLNFVSRKYNITIINRTRWPLKVQNIIDRIIGVTTNRSKVFINFFEVMEYMPRILCMADIASISGFNGSPHLLRWGFRELSVLFRACVLYDLINPISQNICIYYLVVMLDWLTLYLYMKLTSDVLGRGICQFRLHDVHQPRRSCSRLRHAEHNWRWPSVLDNQEQVFTTFYPV